ncbi:hypothetical protein N9O61_03625 [Octadecabacter sp.]|nr:hypothetical protein [Octadecabacter sp.]
MSRRAIDRLLRLLDLERSALLKGDLDTVAGLIGEKEELVTQFEETGSAELRALSFKLAQNGRLLEAAKSGVGDALTTVKKLRQARSSLSSYDRTGKATEIRQTPGSTDRRF